VNKQFVNKQEEVSKIRILAVESHFAGHMRLTSIQWMTLLPRPKPNVDQVLRTAIEHRHLLRLLYKGKERIVEPHDYGIHKGSVKLLGYQVGGASSNRLPNWRWMEADLISDIEILDQTFPGGRPTPSGKHHQWETLFLRVRPADKSRNERAPLSSRRS
jgi:hypothetical protein